MFVDFSANFILKMKFAKKSKKPGLLRSEIEWKFVGMDLLDTSIKGPPPLPCELSTHSPRA